MTFDNYLNEKLKNLFNYQLTLDEEKALKLGQVKQLLFKKITSNKFTKNNLREDSKKLIYKKISDSVDANKPLYLIFCFGGYKNTWVKDYHPFIDWAEVFNLIYVSNLLAPLSKIYAPGIIYEFEAEDGAVVEEDNFLQSDIDSYAKSFKDLLEHFNNTYLPSNVRFRYKRLGEQYDTVKFFEELQPLIKTKIEEFKLLPKEELDTKIKRAKFNFKINGRTDYSNLNELELREKYIESLAINSAFLEKDFGMREDYFIGTNHIPLIGAYCTDEENADNWITINSVGNRDNAFWTSKGIVIKTLDGYKFDIVPPSNFENIKSKITSEDSSLLSNIVPVLNSVSVIEQL